MPPTSLSSPTSDSALEEFIQRLAHRSPRLEDLSSADLETLGRLVVMTNLGEDLRRRVALARIDCEAELRQFLAVASPTDSWATVQIYARALDQLDRWTFRQGVDFLDLSPRQADDYIGSLRTGGRSPGSLRVDIAGPSAFFSYLERRYDAVRNPFRGTRARPAYQPIRTLAVPSTAEVETIVAAAGPELRAALVCMSQRGLRVGALPTLQLDGEAFVGRSKGKPIAGQMPAPVLQAIASAGLSLVRPFSRLTGRHLADRVRRHIERLATRGAVGAVYSAHDLRHFFAVTDYQTHHDLYRLKVLLGHADLAITERYLRSLKSPLFL
jgi:site-specific recombinase XerD